MSEEMKSNMEDELQENTQGNVADEQENMLQGEELADEMTAESDKSAIIEEQFAQLQDTHLRLMAEYDNYRKRTLKEKSELIRNGGEKVLRELLPVIDDLDIALDNMEKSDDLEALREGMRLIHSKFVTYLGQQGVKAIETADAPFDEELHEAIATFPAPSEEQKGRIIDCVKRGYMLGDKVIRHASVVVGQ